MKKIFLFVLIIHFISNNSTAQVYQIPGALTQPIWVFPIYLEEGTGQRDTLYIGYDPLASSTSFEVQDTIFGVKKMPIDTTKFYALWGEYWCGTTTCLEGIKVNVTSISFNNAFPQAIHFTCNKGVLPLKISWDKQLFYSDSLPYPSHTPGPQGQGRFYFDFSHGSIRENFQQISSVDGEILICDSNCFAMDSVVVYNVFGIPAPVNNGSLFLYIQEWTNGWVGLNQPFDMNPKINIEYINGTFQLNNNVEPINIEIFDMLGRSVSKKYLRTFEKLNFEMRNQGMFLLHIYNDSYYHTYKFINYETN